MRNWLIGAAFLAVVACKQEKKEDPVKEAVEEVSQEVAVPNWEVRVCSRFLFGTQLLVLG